MSSVVNYFKSQWLDENTGWHEGTALGFPSTNNGLEATNRWVKERETFKNKLDCWQWNQANAKRVKYENGKLVVRLKNSIEQVIDGSTFIYISA